MTQANLAADNHYLSQGYLERWQSAQGKVWVYRLLVPHQNVPLWRARAIKGIAFQRHLYTRKIAGDLSDKIEKWFSAEFEAPAGESIRRVIENGRLTPEDWRKLIRFLAVHDVRTPARLVEYLERSPSAVSQHLEKVLSELPMRIAELSQSGNSPPQIDSIQTAFPLKVIAETVEGEAMGVLRAETAVGRASWLWSVEHTLNNTIGALYRHKWTILHPAKGQYWITSDKPVIRMNYYGHQEYDFKGGWGREGCEIFLPISPEHLLYTIVGSRPPSRGTILNPEYTSFLNKLIAEHAHRYIFARQSDNDAPFWHPRTVSAEDFREEQHQWRKWHAEQTESEGYFLA